MKGRSNSKLKRILKKQYIINILISLVTIILIFCVGELILRVIFPLPKNTGHLRRSEWNRDYRKSVFIPNTEVIDSGVPTKINSLGLKNKEIDLHKAENILRILVFGDSFTYGAGLLINDTLSSQLERRLNMDNNDFIEIQVINFGVSGMNTFQEVMYTLNYGLRFNPDIIMIVWIHNDMETNGYKLHDYEYFVKNGTVPRKNDMAFSSQVQGERIGFYKGNKTITMRFWNFYEKLKRKSRFIQFVGPRMKQLSHKVGLNLKTSEKIIYSDLDSEGFRLSFNSLKYINNELNKNGIEFYTILYPILQRLNDNYYNELIYKKVENYCNNHNINCLNLSNYFRDKELSRLHLSKVDQHPNRYANEIASEAIEKYLKLKSKLFVMK